MLAQQEDHAYFTGTAFLFCFITQGKKKKKKQLSVTGFCAGQVPTALDLIRNYFLKMVGKIHRAVRESKERQDVDLKHLTVIRFVRGKR